MNVKEAYETTIEQIKELLQILEEVYALEIMNTNANKIFHIVGELRWGDEPNLSDVIERVKALAPYCNGEADEAENQLDTEKASFIHGWIYISLKSAVQKLYPIEFCNEVIPLISESYNRVLNIIADREWVESE